MIKDPMKVVHESLPTIKPAAIKVCRGVLKGQTQPIKIADLGSGSDPQIFLDLSQNFAIDYYALDSDKKKLTTMVRKFTKKPNNLKIVNARVEKIPLPSNTFDILIFLETIEHLPYPEGAIREIKRIAKKNALLLISTPNIERPDVLLKRFLYFIIGKKKNYPKDYYYSSEHPKEWNEKDFFGFLKNHGLTVKRKIPISYPLEFVDLRSLVLFIVYPIFNFLIWIFNKPALSPILFAICRIEKEGK